MHHYKKSIQYIPYNSILKDKLFKNKVLKGFGIIKLSKSTVNHRFFKNIISVYFEKSKFNFFFLNVGIQQLCNCKPQNKIKLYSLVFILSPAIYRHIFIYPSLYLFPSLLAQNHYVHHLFISKLHSLISFTLSLLWYYREKKNYINTMGILQEISNLKD